ncbi:MAG: hypothetical protein OXE41_05050 [Gammaproteobacteria bacterium]|nr:hypothetical protein [Gammaproteobacteria bacterium]MCY4274746.1 hypothetical protein [Gammaproteobacteria bacterium]
MLATKKNLIRMVIQDLLDDSKEDVKNGCSVINKSNLMDLSTHEMEETILHCTPYVHVDIPSIYLQIKRTRRNRLIRDFMKAGTSNDLLRKLFGLSVRNLSRMRRAVNIQNPGRPRHLSIEEEDMLIKYCEDNPAPNGSELLLARWCLNIHSKTNIPFMTIYRWLNPTIENN